MEYHSDKVDEMTLALMYLVSTRLGEGQGARASRGLNMETLSASEARQTDLEVPQTVFRTAPSSPLGRHWGQHPGSP